MNHKTSARPFPPIDGTIPFDRIQDAVQFASFELEEGRAIKLWPISHEGYVVVARRANGAPNTPEFDPYAPTVPMELDGLAERRRSILRRLRGSGA